MCDTCSSYLDVVQELQAGTSTTSLHLFISIIKGWASNSWDLWPCLLWLLVLGPLVSPVSCLKELVSCSKDTKCSFSGALLPYAQQPNQVCFQNEFGHQLFWSLCVANIIQLTAPTTIWPSQQSLACWNAGYLPGENEAAFTICSFLDSSAALLLWIFAFETYSVSALSQGSMAWTPWKQVSNFLRAAFHFLNSLKPKP